MSDEKQYSVDDIQDALNTSNEVELGWYQKTDIIGHTGLVLIFDGEKKFTIDFGTSDGTAFPGKAIGGKRGGVHIYGYKEEYDFKFVLTTIPKDNLIDFVHESLSHKKDSYNLLTNNCRDFVAAIANELHRTGKLSDETYKKLMKALRGIEGNDHIKMFGVVSLGLGALYVLYKKLFGTEKSKEEEDEESKA